MSDFDTTPMRDWIDFKRKNGDLPDWAGRLADETSRDALAETYQGTHDIAGAAEALAEEGDIDYTQATAQEIAEAVADAELPPTRLATTVSPASVIRDAFMGWADEGWRYVTQGNCYEFIHLAGQFSCDDPQAFSSEWGNSIDDVIEPGSAVEWDGSSPIPRGKVIIGIASKFWGGQGSDGTYHFAVSLGDGKVVNNRGDGAQIELVDDVFGGAFTVYARQGGRIIYGDYRHFTPRTSAPEPADDEPSVDERDTRNPRSAAEQRTVVKRTGVAAGAATAALLGVFFGFGDEPTAVPAAAAPTTASVAESDDAASESALDGAAGSSLGTADGTADGSSSTSIPGTGPPVVIHPCDVGIPALADGESGLDNEPRKICKVLGGEGGVSLHVEAQRNSDADNHLAEFRRSRDDALEVHEIEWALDGDLRIVQFPNPDDGYSVALWAKVLDVPIHGDLFMWVQADGQMDPQQGAELILSIGRELRDALLAAQPWPARLRVG